MAEIITITDEAKKTVAKLCNESVVVEYDMILNYPRIVVTCPPKRSPVVLFSPLGHSLVESGRPACTDWTAKKDLLGSENR